MKARLLDVVEELLVATGMVVPLAVSGLASASVALSLCLFDVSSSWGCDVTTTDCRSPCTMLLLMLLLQLLLLLLFLLLLMMLLPMLLIVCACITLWGGAGSAALILDCVL